MLTNPARTHHFQWLLSAKCWEDPIDWVAKIPPHIGKGAHPSVHQRTWYKDKKKRCTESTQLIAKVTSCCCYPTLSYWVMKQSLSFYSFLQFFQVCNRFPEHCIVFWQCFKVCIGNGGLYQIQNATHVHRFCNRKGLMVHSSILMFFPCLFPFPFAFFLLFLHFSYFIFSYHLPHCCVIPIDVKELGKFQMS